MAKWRRHPSWWAGQQQERRFDLHPEPPAVDRWQLVTFDGPSRFVYYVEPFSVQRIGRPTEGCTDHRQWAMSNPHRLLVTNDETPAARHPAANRRRRLYVGSNG